MKTIRRMGRRPPRGSGPEWRELNGLRHHLDQAAEHLDRLLRGERPGDEPHLEQLREHVRAAMLLGDQQYHDLVDGLGSPTTPSTSTSTPTPTHGPTPNTPEPGGTP